jgi:hypothetical protein
MGVGFTAQHSIPHCHPPAPACGPCTVAVHTTPPAFDGSYIPVIHPTLHYINSATIYRIPNIDHNPSHPYLAWPITLPPHISSNRHRLPPHLAPARACIRRLDWTNRRRRARRGRSTISPELASIQRQPRRHRRKTQRRRTSDARDSAGPLLGGGYLQSWKGGGRDGGGSACKVSVNTRDLFISSRQGTYAAAGS